MKKIFFLSILCTSVISCGTLGHIVFYDFDNPKQQIEENLLKVIGEGTLYQAPSKWSHAAIGYDSLDEKFIYFRSSPEEMYEIAFTGDKLEWDSSTSCELGLVGVFKGDKWMFEEGLSNKEKMRMQKRLEDEILSKIEYHYTKSD